MELIPQFLKIRAALEEQIKAGVMQAGSKLPAERKLADAFATTRITLREALALLEAEGMIYREGRRGWFVSPPRIEYKPGKREHFHEMVLRQGRKPGTDFLTGERIAAPSDLCQRLELAPLSPLFQIKRVRSIDQRPVLYTEHYLRCEAFPGIMHEDLNGSMTEIYQARYGLSIERIRVELYPTALVGEAAESLNVGQGSQGLLIVRRNYYQGNRLLDCDYEYWRHDAIRIAIDTSE